MDPSEMAHAVEAVVRDTSITALLRFKLEDMGGPKTLALGVGFGLVASLLGAGGSGYLQGYSQHFAEKGKRHAELFEDKGLGWWYRRRAGSRIGLLSEEDMRGCEYFGPLPDGAQKLLEGCKNYKQKRSEGKQVVLPGVLFHGPTGTGKTTLARRIAREANLLFVEALSTSFDSDKAGYQFGGVSGYFAALEDISKRRGEPIVLFIDESDQLTPSREELGARGGAGDDDARGRRNKRAYVTEFLQAAEEAKKKGHVVLWGATNMLETMDDASKRRYDNPVEIPEPKEEHKIEILQRYIAAVDKTRTNVPDYELLRQLVSIPAFTRSSGGIALEPAWRHGDAIRGYVNGLALRRPDGSPITDSVIKFEIQERGRKFAEDVERKEAGLQGQLSQSSDVGEQKIIREFLNGMCCERNRVEELVQAVEQSKDELGACKHTAQPITWIGKKGAEKRLAAKERKFDEKTWLTCQLRRFGEDQSADVSFETNEKPTLRQSYLYDRRREKQWAIPMEKRWPHFEHHESCLVRNTHESALSEANTACEDWRSVSNKELRRRERVNLQLDAYRETVKPKAAKLSGIDPTRNKAARFLGFNTDELPEQTMKRQRVAKQAEMNRWSARLRRQVAAVASFPGVGLSRCRGMMNGVGSWFGSFGGPWW